MADKSFFGKLKGKWDEAWDFKPEIKELGQGLGFVESDEEKEARLLLEAERDTQIEEAEALRKEPWKDPNIAAASIAMARQQANVYRQMKNRGLSAGEQSRITGESLTKFNIQGNQNLAVLQMRLRAVKAKEVKALKQEQWELARAARVEKQQIAKLILDLTQMGLSLANPTAGAGVGALEMYLKQQQQAEAYKGADYAAGKAIGSINSDMDKYSSFGDAPETLTYNP